MNFKSIALLISTRLRSWSLQDILLAVMVMFVTCIMFIGAVISQAPMIVPIIMALYFGYRLIDGYLDVKKAYAPARYEQITVVPEEAPVKVPEYLSDEWVESLDNTTRETLVDLMLANGGVTIDLTTQSTPPSLEVYRRNTSDMPDETTVEVMVGSAKLVLTYQQANFLNLLFAAKKRG